MLADGRDAEWRSPRRRAGFQLPSIALIKHTPAFKGADPLARLVPVSAFSTLPGVVVANAALPAHSMADVVRWIDSQEKMVNYFESQHVEKVKTVTDSS